MKLKGKVFEVGNLSDHSGRGMRVECDGDEFSIVGMTKEECRDAKKWLGKEIEVTIAVNACCAEAVKNETPGKETTMECHKLDTEAQVFFYEQDFYVLSNFSAFNLEWEGRTFPTSEHAYHWEKFYDEAGPIAFQILNAPSAHEAFKIAERNKERRRPDWDAVKVDVMRDILRAKAEQHEYVRRKLLATGDRELVEDSWRDDFWGWGLGRDGKNMLGRLWMEVRAELKTPNV